MSAMPTSSGFFASPTACRPYPGDAERDGDDEPVQRTARLRAAELMDVDLEAGEEEQETEAEQRRRLHGLVHLDDVEHGRAQHDSRDDLDDRARHRKPRNEAEQERYSGRHGRDDQQIVE
jgi:hypothetical protein